MFQNENRLKHIRLANIALAAMLFLDPVLNQAAISPIQSLTPAQLHQEFSVQVEVAKELSLVDFQPQSEIKYRPKTEALDLQEMARIGMALQKEYAFDPGTIIPTNLPRNSSSQSYVATKVLQHSLEHWYSNRDSNSSGLKNTAAAVADGLNTSLDDSSHLKFKVQPVAGKAALRYEGSINAELSFDAFEQESKFVVGWNF